MRKLAGLIVLLMCSALISACTGQTAAPTPASPPTTGTQATPATQSAPQASPAAQAPSQATPPIKSGTETAANASPDKWLSSQEGQPKKGGVLRYVGRVDPPTFDVNMDRTADIYSPAGQVFSGLVRVNPFDQSEIVPDLAEKWDVSPDGKLYTFYLRKGVKWHDGKPFTAKDVDFSLHKLADAKRSTMSALFANMDRVEVVDDNTLKVYLKGPEAPFLSTLSNAQAKVMRQDVVEKGSANDPAFFVGTGPFKFKARVAGKEWDVEKNPDYYIKGLPYLDGVKVYLMSNYSDWISAFVGGRVDMTSPNVAIPGYDNYQNLKSLAPKDAKLQLAPMTYYTHLVFNLKNKAPWQDANVRQAIRLVLDQKQLAIAGMGSADFGLPGGFIPPGTPMAVPANEVKTALGQDKSAEDRIAQAKKLMQTAGYADGFAMRILYRTNDEYKLLASVAADLLNRSLGIKVTLQELELAQERAKVKAGDFDLDVDAKLYSVDPHPWLSAWATSSPENVGGYSNADLDTLIDQQGRTTDVSKRTELVRKAEAILLKDAPSIVAYYQVRTAAWQSYVKGYRGAHADIYSGGMRMDYVWLDK